MIVVVGLSHKGAPLEIRERLAVGPERVPEVLAALTRSPSIGEAVVLSTCNRVEVYAAPRTRGGELGSTAQAAVEVLAGIGGDAVVRHLGRLTGEPAVRHLFRVASSLDSLVVGEPQILGQLKEAIEIAREARALGTTLGRVMHHAVRVGKRVRTETSIGEGQVSVSSVAVDLARDIFGDLEGRRTLLVGAGEMAEAAAKLLLRAGASLVVVNRSLERAQALAREVGASTRSWSELDLAIVEADIVISSTSSPRPIVTVDLLKRVRKARRGRSLFLIDIAVPRDVEPEVHRLENVFLYNVDDLSAIVAESLSGRAAEAAKAEAIVEQEARGFDRWTLERSVAPTIVSLRARTRAVLAAEVERSLAGKLRHLGAAEREALAVMIDAATNKLLHAPVTRLKATAGDPRGAELVEAVRELFELSDSPASEAAAPPSAAVDGKKPQRAWPEAPGAAAGDDGEAPAASLERRGARPATHASPEPAAIALRSVPDGEL